jgi:hypothetical protein
LFEKLYDEKAYLPNWMADMQAAPTHWHGGGGGARTLLAVMLLCLLIA